MNLLHYLIIIPFVVGLFCLVIPKKLSKLRDLLAIGGGLATFYFTIVGFLRKPIEWSYNNLLLLKVDNLSGFILLAIGLFGVLIVVYSLKFMAGKERQGALKRILHLSSLDNRWSLRGNFSKQSGSPSGFLGRWLRLFDDSGNRHCMAFVWFFPDGQY
jgi:hypothetical protein